MDNIKSFIKYLVIALICIIILWMLFGSFGDDTTEEIHTSKVGQKYWTYNIKNSYWNKYSINDEDNKENKVYLKYEISQEEPEKTFYELITNEEILNPKNLSLGEGSIEFLKDKRLYSYYPRNFQYYEIIFNSIEFVPYKLSQKNISELFNTDKIIKVSDIVKGNYKIKLTKDLYIIINDIGSKFYRYYIIPNNSKSLQIGDFTNQFRVKEPVKIKLQRLEGCSKDYPCYEFEVRK